MADFPSLAPEPLVSRRRRRARKATHLVVFLALLFGVTSLSSPAASAQTDETHLRPSFIGAPYFAPGAIYTQNFPDPSVVWDSTTQRYYAFSTTTGGVYVPVMWSTDLVTWTARATHTLPNANSQYHDALPDPSPVGHPWQSNEPNFPDEVWAPFVTKLSGGGASAWVMFYSLRMDSYGKHCIYYATSPTPDGPYLAPKQMYCGDRPLGYIDPSVFSEGSNTWLVLKDEGQVGVAWSAIWAREIVLTNAQTVSWKYPDGSPGGFFTPLLEASGGWERGVVENPSLARLSDGGLTLFYSGGWWDTDGYAVGMARCGAIQLSWTPICTRVGNGQAMRTRFGMKGIGGSAAFRGAAGELYLANHYWDEGLPAGYPSNQRRLVVDRVFETPGGLAYSHESSPVVPSAPSGYAPIGPTRVVDTRYGVGVSTSRALEAGEVFVLDLSSQTTSTTTSVTINVTVDAVAAPGFLTAYACGEPPLSSTLNYAPGAVSTNLATVRLTTTRKVCFFTQSSTHLIIDLQGRYDTALTSAITPVTPTRVIDTRYTSIVPAGGQLNVPIVGQAGVPAGATAVVASITADAGAGTGFLTAWQCGSSVPIVSNVNYGVGWPSGNGAIVPLSSGGEICIYSQHRAHVIVDVFGYVSNSGQRLEMITPNRVLDSRTSIGIVSGGQTIAVPVTGFGRAASGSTAVEVNITATDVRAPGWVSVFPCSSQPSPGNETSVLNLVTGQTKAAHVVVSVGTSGAGAGSICLRTQERTHLIVDLSGGYG